MSAVSLKLRFQLATRRLRCWYCFLVIYLSYKFLQLRIRLIEKFSSSDYDSDQLWSQTHAKNAKRAYDTILYLEGLWIKAGQYVSTRVDVFPSQYTSLLSHLQDSLPEKPWLETCNTICSQLNITSLDQVFDHVDPVPLATASIAQVHRAKVKPSHIIMSTQYGSSVHQDVVIKVQHTGVDLLITQDIQDLTWVVWLIGKFEPDYDLSPIVDEWANEVPYELDFIHEASNVITMYKEYQSYNQRFVNQENFALDCIFSEPCLPLTTKKVFVMEYLPGLKLADPAVKNGNVNDLALKIMRAYGCSIYYLGFWNADPHLGNFLVINDTPCLLDFGLTKKASPQEVMALCRILIAAAEMDYTSLLSGLYDLKLKFPVDQPERAMNVIRYLFRNTTTLQENRKEFREFNDKMKESKDQDKLARERVKQLQKERKELSVERQGAFASSSASASGSALEQETGKKASDAFPGILVFFGRVLNLLRGLCSTIEAQINYMDVMVPFARLHIDQLLTPQVRTGLATFSRIPYGPLEEKIRATLRKAITDHDALGIQVCVIQNGLVIADVYAGIQGTFDPKPVRGDTLFPVFSCTKALASASLHLLLQEGKCGIEDYVVQYWPQFVSSSLPESKEKQWKQSIKIKHLLEHSAGLAAAGNSAMSSDPFLITNWAKMLYEMEQALPEHEPGKNTKYHALSYGWLVGHLVEKIAALDFQKYVNQNWLEPAGINGKNTRFWEPQSADHRDVVDHECPGDGYVGIPIGIEDRMALVQMDMEKIRHFVKRFGKKIDEKLQAKISSGMDMSALISSKAPSSMALMANPGFFNDVRIRRSVIPAVSGNFSARGLCLFYSHLMEKLDPTTLERIEKSKSKEFKLGFRAMSFRRASGFGHPGLGGSLGFCVPKEKLAVAITINKLSILDRKTVKEVVEDVAKMFNYGDWKEESIKNDVTANPFKN